jgi:hypothetical protein
MIGPGGLLLLVPHVYAVSVLLVGLPKNKQLNLDIKFYYPELHTEHPRRCSNIEQVKSKKGNVLALQKCVLSIITIKQDKDNHSSRRTENST